MSELATKRFWVDAADRAVRTVAQSAVALLTADGTGLLDTDWMQVGSIAGMAGLLSLLMRIAGPVAGNAVRISDVDSLD